MTRDQKLEAMAREWCKINGWQADFRQQELTWEEVIEEVKTGRPRHTATSRLGPPTWQLHVKAMDRLLQAIGE